MEGAITNATTDINFNKIFNDGPEVSQMDHLQYHQQQRLCVLLFLSFLASIIFLALSQAPPAFDWKIAIKTPHVVTPANNPPSISAPPIKPINTGTIIANKPGATISRIDACVEISTHLSYSATPLAASKIFLSSAEALDISELSYALLLMLLLMLVYL